ncbi:FFLEELY motif protein [Lysobacter olei]
MARTRDLSIRLPDLLQRHQRLTDPSLEPRNRLRWLPELRRWQAGRLRHSFAHFLDDPKRQAAAEFFLTDVYGDHDFTRRDADIARVVPLMQKLLPDTLLASVADAIELGLLTHAFDLRMAGVLESLAPRRRRLDGGLYGEAYRACGLPRLRDHQIDLIARVGTDLGRGLELPGVRMLLKLSRGPAQAAGLAELQGFLERGVEAFARLGDPEGFIAEIERDERLLSRRLFAGDPLELDGEHA